MILSFTLTMPSNNSWNGRWSGDGKLYAITRTLRPSKKTREFIESLLEERRFIYRWDDGWMAAITVEHITYQQARKLRKKSLGFCGYEWMVDSILTKGFITTD